MEWLYRQAYQRTATPEQVERSLDFIRAAESITPPPPPEAAPAPEEPKGKGKNKK